MIQKKVVVILVIIALVLACISISCSVFNLGKKVPTTFSNNQDAGQGRVGVYIYSPQIEDKGVGG